MSMWIRNNLSLLLLSLSIGLVVFTTTINATLIDLSQDWTEAPLYNKNKAYCSIQAEIVPAFVIGYVILQNGSLLAEGYTEGSNSTGHWESYSLTKCWSSLMIGQLIVELGLLSTEETLLDIFDQPEDWDGVKQAEEKQTITLQELLSMTSGLKPCFVQNNFLPQDTLQEILNQADFEADQRGKFYYLEQNHILSRIILRRSGLTPRQFAMEMRIFDKLGIAEANYTWETNGGVETTATGFQTNPRVHAKLAQLYLQDGFAAEGDSLIAKEWVNLSTTDQLLQGDTTYLTPEGELDAYGYQGWFTNKDDYSGILEGFIVAFGVFGQIMAYQPSTNTTIAIMGKAPIGSASSYNLLKNMIRQIPNLNIEQTECTENLSYFDYARNNGVEVLSLLGDQIQRLINTFFA